MTKLGVKLLASIAGFYCAVYFFPAIRVDRPETYLWAGLVLGLINLLIRPVLLLFALPINILTLGLFNLILNTWMVMLTDALLPSLNIPGFGLAFLTALIVSGINIILNLLIEPA